MIRTYAGLRARTGDRVRLRLIELSRRWWMLWTVVRIIEETTGDSAQFFFSMMAIVGKDLEYDMAAVAYDMAAVASRAVYDAFTAWATEQKIGFEASLYIDISPAWDKPDDEMALQGLTPDMLAFLNDLGC